MKHFTGPQHSSLQWRDTDYSSMRNFFVLTFYSRGASVTLSALNVCDTLQTLPVGETLYIAQVNENTVFGFSSIERMNDTISRHSSSEDDICGKVDYTNGWAVKRTEKRFIARRLDWEF